MGEGDFGEKRGDSELFSVSDDSDSAGQFSFAEFLLSLKVSSLFLVLSLLPSET